MAELKGLLDVAIAKTKSKEAVADTIKEALEKGYISKDEGQEDEEIIDAMLDYGPFSNSPYEIGENMTDDEREIYENKIYRFHTLHNLIYSEGPRFPKSAIIPHVETALFFNETPYALNQNNIDRMSREILENNDFDDYIQDKVKEYIIDIGDEHEGLLIDPIRFDK